MAQIIYNIPDEQMPRVIEAMADHFGYEGFVPDEDGRRMPNPETKAVFAHRELGEFIKSTTTHYEGVTAGRTAGQEARGKAESEIDIT